MMNNAETVVPILLGSWVLISVFALWLMDFRENIKGVSRFFNRLSWMVRHEIPRKMRPPVFGSLPGKQASIQEYRELGARLGLIYSDANEVRLYLPINSVGNMDYSVSSLLNLLDHPDMTVEGRPNAMNVVVTYVLYQSKVYRIDFLMNISLQAFEPSRKNLYAFRLETNLKQYAEMNRLQRIVESAKRGA